MAISVTMMSTLMDLIEPPVLKPWVTSVVFENISAVALAMSMPCWSVLSVYSTNKDFLRHICFVTGVPVSDYIGINCIIYFVQDKCPVWNELQVL